MICRQCGKEIDDESAFCEFCGEKVTNGNQSSEAKEKNSINYNKDLLSMRPKIISPILIVSVLVALFVGSLVSGLLTYNIGAKPVLEKMAIVKAKEKQAKRNERDTEKLRKEAAEYLAEINNIKVDITKPTKTKLQGNAVVGIDIAPGTYTFSAKEGDSAFYHYFQGGGDDYVWGKNGTEIILKAGEELKEIDDVTTFIPVNEG